MSDIIDAIRAHAWETLLVHLALGVLALLVARRSQVDAWAESNPRLAGVMKLMRALSIDPWMIAQAFMLILVKRLPEDPKVEIKPPSDDDPPTGENPVGPHATKLPPNPRWGGPVAMVALALIGCGAAQQPRECDESKVTAHTARCKARVALECADIPEEQLETACPVIAQCDAELDRICPESP